MLRKDSALQNLLVLENIVLKLIRSDTTDKVGSALPKSREAQRGQRGMTIFG
jgi:hypothetical protein